MSAGHDDGSSLISITAGTLLTAVVAGAVGMFTAATSWPLPAAATVGWTSSFGLAWAGLLIGGVMGLAVAACMSWHGSALGASEARTDLAMVWGIIPGLLFGAALGPVFAGIMGLFFGQLVPSLFLGLYFGPIAGVMGWQIGYFVSNLLHDGSRTSHGH
jgi:hypothetical protein